MLGGLFGKRDTGPRVVCCPNCGGSQEVASAAQSVVCRHCHVTIKVSDQTITQFSSTVSLETCGELTIEKKGQLVAQKRVVAANLTLKGSLKGNATVYDVARIGANAQMVGDLKARLLKVEDGATLKGFFQIIPAEGCVVVEPPKEMQVKVRAS